MTTSNLYKMLPEVILSSQVVSQQSVPRALRHISIINRPIYDFLKSNVYVYKCDFILNTLIVTYFIFKL